MVPRAYLAHSSSGKPYVEDVVCRLSRAHVVYDRMSFEPGEDFRQLIRQGLERSSLLVLFASTASLQSAWVRFEVDEYEIRQIRDPSNRILVIGIDPTIGVQDLPSWMRRALALLGGASPAHAARMIQQRLAEQVAFAYQPPFVGRETEISELAQDLFPRPGERPPPIIIISGLTGVGRRTFARRVFQDYLSLGPGPIIVIREHDTTENVYVRLLDEVGEMRTRNDLAAAIGKFGVMDVGAKGEEIARLLEILSKDNVAVVFVDDYQVFLDEGGRYKPDVRAIFEAIAQRDNVYATIIHRRRPSVVALQAMAPRLTSLYALRPLDLEATKLLLAQHTRLAAVQANPQQINELALSVEGYPPLAALATRLAKLYGLTSILANKSLLTDFKIRTFVPLLTRVPLSDPHWQVLRLLSAEVALPLDVVTTALGITHEETARLIRELVDYNLVVPAGTLYELSGPLRDAVSRLKGPLTDSEYAELGSRLRQEYWRDPGVIPPLSVVDATLHAIARSNSRELQDFRDIVMPSLLYRVAAEAYHGQDWEEAENFARRALAAQPDLHDAREILLKAFCKQGKWAQAEEVLADVQARGLRRQFYLKGFLEWQRRNLPEAVSALRAALRVGDRSVSVIRDLAHCLFRLGAPDNLEEAKRLVTRALDRPNPNRFIVDLAAQIAIARRSWREARELVSLLERVDSEQRFRHRRAALHAAQGRFNEALVDARFACSARKPVFEMRAQLADILAEAGEFEEAMKAIEALPAYTESQQDIQIGLKCKWFLRQDRWREAEALWAQLIRNDLPVHQGLRREILRQKAADRLLAPLEREKAEAQFAQIGAQPAVPWVVETDEPD